MIKINQLDKNGEKTGLWRYYDDNGKLIKTERY